MANAMITHPFVDQLDEWQATAAQLAEAIDFLAFHAGSSQGAQAGLSLLVDQLARHVQALPFPALDQLRDWEIDRPLKS